MNKFISLVSCVILMEMLRTFVRYELKYCVLFRPN